MTSIRYLFLLRCRIETQHNKDQHLGSIRTRCLIRDARRRRLEDTSR